MKQSIASILLVGVAAQSGLLLVASSAAARDAGSPTMLTFSPRPDWYVRGVKYRGRMGESVGTAGDVNGDGFIDVILGAPTATEAGRVYVCFGSAAGLTRGFWTIEKGTRFGSAVSTAGDVNGDGFDDVIIGKPFGDEKSAGQVAAYYGSATGLRNGTAPDWTAVNADAGLGYSVSTAGDVNGDGYADVVVGGPFLAVNNDDDVGEARTYLGSASGLTADPIWMAYGDTRFARFGYAVDTAGDVNGDGYDDIIVGSPSLSFGADAAVYAFYGSPDGPSASPDWVAPSLQETIGTFGSTVAAAGDVNDDGFDDVIIGDYGANHSGGAAYVYHGSPAGLSANPNWIGAGDFTQDYGFAVHTAGDVNGDGFSDVLVGAPVKGWAYLYYGSSVGLRDSPGLTLKGTDSNGQLGYSVGTAGDVNGDGLDDLIVGSPGFSEFKSDAGVVLVYYSRRQRVH